MHIIKLCLTAFFFFGLFGCSSHSDQEVKPSNKKNSLDSAQSNADNPSDRLNNAPLFKNYLYGQPFEMYSKSPDFSDCSDFFEQQALCKDDVLFLDHSFTAGLLFENKKLTSVVLYTEYSDELFATLMGSLPNNNFGLAMLNDSKEQIDVLQNFKQKGETETIKIINEFESRMVDEPEINLSFVENPKQFQSCKNITEVIQKMNETNRGIDVFLEDDDEQNTWIYLSFLFPKKEYQNLIKKDKF